MTELLDYYGYGNSRLKSGSATAKKTFIGQYSDSEILFLRLGLENMFNSIRMEDFESPVRKMVADSRSEPYVAIVDLATAKQTEDAYLVMDGDDGGQVYLVTPLNIVACDEDALRALLRYFDGRVWKDISMASIRYEIHNGGDIIWGGMGGGRVEGGLWIHEEFSDSKEGIEKILRGSSLPDILE